MKPLCRSSFAAVVATPCVCRARTRALVQPGLCPPRHLISPHPWPGTTPRVHRRSSPDSPSLPPHDLAGFVVAPLCKHGHALRVLLTCTPATASRARPLATPFSREAPSSVRACSPPRSRALPRSAPRWPALPCHRFPRLRLALPRSPTAVVWPCRREPVHSPNRFAVTTNTVSP